jgi:hypothetical protein
MAQTPFDKFEERELPKDLKHWRNAFDSRYLRVFWLNGKPRVVTITEVRELKSSNKRDSKTQLLITLAEAEKRWAANVTNCGILEMLAQNADPRSWVGMKITLYPTKTRDPNGQMVDCIRVREELPPQNAKTEKPKHRQEVAQYLDEMAKSETLAALGVVIERLGGDDDLSQQEAAFLLGCVEKRRGQLMPKQEEVAP